MDCYSKEVLQEILNSPLILELGERNKKDVPLLRIFDFIARDSPLRRTGTHSNKTVKSSRNH